MIENLKGSFETVAYRDDAFIRLYDNTDVEAYPRHWHTCIEIILPVEGCYEVEYGGQTALLQPGDLLFLCPGALHAMGASPGMRYIFQAEMASVTQLRSIDSFLTIFYPGILITRDTSPEVYPHIHRLMLEIAEEYHKEPVLHEASIYAKLLEMIVLIRRRHSDSVLRLSTSASRQKEYLDKFTEVCSYISDHCTENLTLDGAAARAGFSKYHFSRLFKQFTNVSFYKYLNQKRIETAERLLIDPSLSVTEVSLSSGYASLSSFIRMFKQIKGCTPSEYRSLYNL